MSQQKIESLLKQRIGLNPSSVGSVTIEHAVSKRMSSGGIEDITRYVELVSESQKEFELLIDEVVVPETWFFRSAEAFDSLVRYVRDEWLLQNPGKCCRLLSIPCSSGEEPYSMAMALLGAGVPAGSFHIDAVDVSQHNLHNAKKAIYGNGSFRSQDLKFRDRYFSRNDEHHYRLHRSVSSVVSFHHANLFDTDLMRDAASYQVIFCRNLLIYFDRSTQVRAVSVLRGLLDAEGVLFMGHAETGSFLKGWHPSLRFPLSFAYRKFDDGALSGRKKRLFQPRSLKSQLEPTRSTTAHTKTAVSDAPLPFAGEAPKQRSASEEPLQRAARVATVEVEVNQEISIEQARALADNGDMQAASVCCQQLIDINGSDAEAFYLLATIHQADGDLGGAESLLRKALYLDPGHYEVVVHLATIMERQGDLDASRRFRQRAERLGDRLNSGVSVE